MTKPIGRNLVIKQGQSTTPETFLTIANMKTNAVNKATGQIDATDKTSSGWRELVAGGIRHVDFSGAGVVSDDATLLALEAAYETGALAKFAMFSGRGDSHVGFFQISTFNRTGDDAQTENFTASFMSSGEVVRCLGAPTITLLSVATGGAAGGTAVTITGTNFAPNPTGNLPPVVKFGNVLATSVVVVSATSITCVTPAHGAGVVDVSVYNPDGRSATDAGSFTYT